MTTSAAAPPADATFTPQARGGGESQADDPVAKLVGQLSLERYKTTLKGLSQFGDREQGTKRNRDAVDWIEAQLKSYGCTNTERIIYTYAPEPRAPRAGGAGRAGQAGRGRAAGSGAASTPPGPPEPGSADWTRRGQAGGSTYYGYRARTGVNRSLEAQPDERLRELNAEPTAPGERQEVYCTKIGTTRPQEMYIVGAHMDGHGKGEAINDDGSGTALVMELARAFHQPGVTTDVSIRFALWNNEETGLNGARAYVEQREALQGKESPVGSGTYPEPKWLGMIQHDMMMWDHGMPRPDGTINPEQRPEADINIEFQSNSKMAEESMKLAFAVKAAADAYTTHYPATVGPHMTNTDSTPFMDIIPAISLRENERGMQTGAGWNPHWHQPTDVFSTFSDKDFMLGLTSAQATLAAVARLAGAKVQ
ncbi:MAG: M20/M25/M40 family metallo-hydrolase [Acidobacteria bacterium]|nr:M20/M25/M40 family metallo-hydrolase [Acidobacteriota bacterium]